MSIGRKFNKNNVRHFQTFEQLPKGAYVVKIKNVEVAQWPSGDNYLRIAFDIAEGEYKDFYKKQFDADSRAEKHWPYDAVFSVGIPSDDSPEWQQEKFDTFISDLEDSNSDYEFSDNEKTMIGKLFGGLFRIEENESNGTVYRHTRLMWTQTASNVRNKKYGKLPNDKLISEEAAEQKKSADDFVDIPDGAEEEIPF